MNPGWIYIKVRDLRSPQRILVLGSVATRRRQVIDRLAMHGYTTDYVQQQGIVLEHVILNMLMHDAAQR